MDDHYRQGCSESTNPFSVSGVFSRNALHKSTIYITFGNQDTSRIQLDDTQIEKIISPSFMTSAGIVLFLLTHLVSKRHTMQDHR